MGVGESPDEPDRGRLSWLAVASFVLGILGLLWLAAIYMAGLLMPLMAGLFESMRRDLAFAIPWLVAILLGLLANRVIRTSSGRLAGAVLARAQGLLWVPGASCSASC